MNDIDEWMNGERCHGGIILDVPHAAWFFTGVTALCSRQSMLEGMLVVWAYRKVDEERGLLRD